MDNRKLFVHVRRETERVVQIDSLVRLITAIREADISRPDVEKEGRTEGVRHSRDDLGGREVLGSVGIVRVDSVAEGRERQALRTPARKAPEDSGLTRLRYSRRERCSGRCSRPGSQLAEVEIMGVLLPRLRWAPR